MIEKECDVYNSIIQETVKFYTKRRYISDMNKNNSEAELGSN